MSSLSFLGLGVQAPRVDWGRMLTEGVQSLYVTPWAALAPAIAIAVVTMVLGAVVANRWFVERKGLVMGALAGSTATGQLLFLPLAAWLIEHHGWRWAVAPVVAMAALEIGRAHV